MLVRAHLARQRPLRMCRYPNKKYQDVVGWLLCSPPGTVSRRLLSCKLQLSISSEPEVLASGSNYVPPTPGGVWTVTRRTFDRYPHSSSNEAPSCPYESDN